MPFRVFAQIALATFLWGTAFPVVKFGFQRYSIPPLAFGGTRFTLAGLLILAIVWLLPRVAGAIPALEHHSRSGRPEWPRVFLIALLSTAIFYALFFMGMQRTSASSGSIVDGSSPLVGAIMAHFVLHDDRLTLRKITAFILAMLGVIVITLGRYTGQIAGVSVSGVVLIFVGIIVSSAGTLLVITYRGSLELLPLMGVQMTIGGVLLLLASLLFENWSAWPAGLDLRFAAVIVWLASLSVVAFRIWYGLVRRYKVSSISVFLFLNAVWGTGLSIAFLGEPFSIQLLAGMVLVAVGLILVNTDPASHERKPLPPLEAP